MKKILIGTMVCSLLPYFSYADNYIDQLLELDIQDLLNIEISVVSKRSEKIKDAPGIVNVVTAKDIETYGAKTLFEVLGRLPSVYANGNASNFDNTIAFRGQSEATDNHMLLLLNGRPMREGYTGGLNAPIYRNFPLDMIEHIEVIRGPGSVLYGTNAFSGVINIVTKKAQKKTEGTISTSLGSFYTKQVNATVGTKGENSNIYGAFKSINSAGWSLKGTDAFGTTGSDKTELNSHGGLVTADYKNFTINAMQTYNNQKTFLIPSAFPLQQYTQNTHFLDIGYTHDLNEDWTLSFNTTYNGYEQDFGAFIGVEENDTLYEVSVDGKITDNINIVAGFVHNTLRGKFSSFGSPSKYRQMHKSGYAQVDYKPIEKLKLVAGIQMNDPQNVKKDFSPRLSAIYNFNDNWGAKLLYGQAFRAAYPVEQFLFLPGAALGDPTLSPEKITTIDAQIYYNAPKYYAAITAFSSKIDDIITIDPVSKFYVNGSTINSQGATLEGTARISSHLNIQGSATYQTNEQNGINDAYGAPNLLAKAGMDYRFDNGITVAVFNSYISERSSSVTDAYNLLTANIKMDVNQVLDLNDFPDTEFSIYGDNLLDESIKNGFAAIPVVPVQSGAAIYGTLKIKF